MGEVGLKVDRRVRAGLRERREQQRRPRAAGWRASRVDAPAGSSAARRSPTVANVTTTSPCSRRSCVAVIVASAVLARIRRRPSAAPAVPGAHDAPAAPSGTRRLHDRVQHRRRAADRRAVFGQRRVAREGAALERRPAAQQRALRQQLTGDVRRGRRVRRALRRTRAPDSSISHTLVIGGSFEAPPALGFVGFGEPVSDSLAGALVVLVGAGVLAAAVVVGALAAGVACGVVAGGGGAVVVGACVCARAASDAIRAGSCCTTPPLPASDAAGRGPIAAPTPTPSAEHRRRERRARAERRQARAGAPGARARRRRARGRGRSVRSESSIGHETDLSRQDLSTLWYVRRP